MSELAALELGIGATMVEVLLDSVPSRRMDST